MSQYLELYLMSSLRLSSSVEVENTVIIAPLDKVIIPLACPGGIARTEGFLADRTNFDTPASFEGFSQSSIFTTPRFSPSTPINLTSGVLILWLSLVYLSELIFILLLYTN